MNPLSTTFRAALIAALSLLFIFKSHSQTTLLPFGSSWKYWANSQANAPAAGWDNPSSSETGWSTGTGEFGYGDGDEGTCVPSGASGTVCMPTATATKYVTTYFRTTVNIPNPALYSGFILNMKRDDGIVVYINGTERYAENMPAGRTYATLALANADDDGDDIITTTLPIGNFISGDNVIAVELHQAVATSSDISFDLELIGSNIPVNLISFGDSWRYLDNGSNQNTAWKETGFNHNLWAQGNSELGYADGPATTVSFGSDANNKHITTYFRKNFNITNLASFGDLTLNIIRDDGMVVYVNGVEVVRDNLPGGTIAYNTHASAAISGAGETTPVNFSLSPCNFVEGANTIAVEMHQSDGASSDLSFDLELFGTPAGGTPLLTRGPYLQMGNETAITIRWRTSVSCYGRVQVGPSSGVYTTATVSETCPTTEHVVRITGLTADTKYFYSIGATDGTVFQGNGENFFTTVPPANSSRKIRIAAFGDCGRGNATFQDQTLSQYRTYLTNNSIDAPDAWILLGDNAYSSGTDQEYTNNFFGIYGNNILKNHKLYPAPGNHDYGNNSSNKQSRTMPYFRNFTIPINGECGGVPSTKPNFYSYDIGNIHFLSLDSWGLETDNSHMGSTNSTLKNWINADLAANTKKWTVAYWHHGAYTKGSHDSDSESELVAIRQNFITYLEQRGVDLVICGHSHVYERGYLLKNFTGPWTSFNSATHAVSTSSAKYTSNTACPYIYNTSPANHGTVYVTAGSTGANASQVAGFNAYAFPFSVADGGIFYFEVEGNRLDAKMLRRNGTIFDNFTILKDVNREISETITIGTPITLTASWPGNHNWDNAGATTRSINFTPSIEGTSVINVTDDFGCVTDKFTIIATNSLPVNLIRYTAVLNAGKVNVAWTTASETNSKHFTIERSGNLRDFEPIGQVIAAGNSADEHDYSFVDYSPLPGTSYYRLSQTDIDNRIHHYDVKKIINTAEKGFTVKQLSEGNGLLVLSINSSGTDKLNLRVFDMSGKEVGTRQIQISAGTRRVEIGLKPGTYVWQIRNRQEEVTSQVVVVK
jgi:hypothetical protein